LPDTRLSAADSAALSDFIQRVRAAFADDVVELRLFRGDAGPDADLDVLVVVGPGPDRWPAARTVSDIAFDVNLEHDVLISPIVLTATMAADPRWVNCDSGGKRAAVNEMEAPLVRDLVPLKPDTTRTGSVRVTGGLTPREPPSPEIVVSACRQSANRGVRLQSESFYG
jgi:hypothetical protein